jgi:hypothetical protein
VSEGDVELVREMLELWTSNQRDAAWGRFSTDAVVVPVRDWPDGGSPMSLEQGKALLDRWDDVFGADWPERLEILRCEDVGENRVLVDMRMRTEGVGSGIPLDQPLLALYTLQGGEIVRADYFNDVAEAERVARGAER